MVARPRLHVLFTMNCPPAGGRAEPHGPGDWELSGCAIDTFCTRLLRAGYPPTLFLTPEAADRHAPLWEEVADIGADVGLLIHPPGLRGAGYKGYLGSYPRDEQRAIVAESLRRFMGALGHRPQSVRSAMFSASDDTFSVLSEAGFRQASVSSPGRRIPRHRAVWTGAAPDAHLANATSRLHAGFLPLLEVPVTTDASRCRGGVSPDLAIENGTVERWHRPLIGGQLERQAAQAVAFRTLCFVTSSRLPFHDLSHRHGRVLDGLVEHLDTLEEQYEIIPTTLAGARGHFPGPG